MLHEKKIDSPLRISTFPAACSQYISRNQEFIFHWELYFVICRSGTLKINGKVMKNKYGKNKNAIQTPSLVGV